MDPGRCATCRHAREVTTTRGSTFWRCNRSATDPRYPKYPRLPVLQCDGHEPSEHRDRRYPSSQQGRARRVRARLTTRRSLPILPATTRRTGNERDEYPSSVGTETRWLVETGATTAANGPGSLRTERRTGDCPTSRLRRRAPAIQGSADRRRGATSPPAGSSVKRVRHTPNEGGTAEGTAFRPWGRRSFLIHGRETARTARTAGTAGTAAPPRRRRI